MENIIGVKMGEIMQEKGITYAELSARIEKHGAKISERELQNIENRTRRVTDIELYAVSKALEVSVEQLICAVKL